MKKKVVAGMSCSSSDSSLQEEIDLDVLNTENPVVFERMRQEGVLGRILSSEVLLSSQSKHNLLKYLCMTYAQPEQFPGMEEDVIRTIRFLVGEGVDVNASFYPFRSYTVLDAAVERVMCYGTKRVIYTLVELGAVPRDEMIVKLIQYLDPLHHDPDDYDYNPSAYVEMRPADVLEVLKKMLGEWGLKIPEGYHLSDFTTRPRHPYTDEIIALLREHGPQN